MLASNHMFFINGFKPFSFTRSTMETPFSLLPLNQSIFSSTRFQNSLFTITKPSHRRRITNSNFLSQNRFNPSSFVLLILPCHWSLLSGSIWCKKQQTRAFDDLILYCSGNSHEKLTSVGWLKYFHSIRKLASGVVALYLFCLTLIGEASADPNVSFGFACEDVSHYYASADYKEGEDLMRVLNSIISPHQSLSYKEVWEALKVLDAADDDNPEASSDIVDIYSLRAVSKLLAGKPEGWNREHLWPRSYGLTDGPSLTDLHNIRPADVNVNSSRGNKYYGECLATSTDCQMPANKEAAYDTETDKKRWAPPLQVRGDIARALMYMAVRYGFNQSDGSPNLHLSDSPIMENKEMGLLSTLLKWNELDPPSRPELLRNNRVCRLYQHNRNPFVDHPEFVNLIWKQATPGSETVFSPLKAWINEFHYNNRGKDKNEFVEIVVESSVDVARLKLALYNGANGKMYRSLSLADKSVFHEIDVGSTFSIYTTFVPLQNGPSDGIALVSDREGGHVQIIQFISYQGVVKAINGPASGMTSVDIGIQETEGSSENDSLGLTGGPATKFTWRKFQNEASPRKLNMGEMFSNT